MSYLSQSFVVTLDHGCNVIWMDVVQHMYGVLRGNLSHLFSE